MSEYIVEMYDECEKYSSEYGCKPTNTHGFPLREEIVRCGDCKFGVDGGKYCAEGCADSWDWRNVEPDGFCAWGERRTDDN